MVSASDESGSFCLRFPADFAAAEVGVSSVAGLDNEKRAERLGRGAISSASVSVAAAADGLVTDARVRRVLVFVLGAVVDVVAVAGNGSLTDS